jgi:hypothetical protein
MRKALKEGIEEKLGSGVGHHEKEKILNSLRKLGCRDFDDVLMLRGSTLSSLMDERLIAKLRVGVVEGKEERGKSPTGQTVKEERSGDEKKKNKKNRNKKKNKGKKPALSAHDALEDEKYWNDDGCVETEKFNDEAPFRVASSGFSGCDGCADLNVWYLKEKGCWVSNKTIQGQGFQRGKSLKNFEAWTRDQLSHTLWQCQKCKKYTRELIQLAIKDRISE